MKIYSPRNQNSFSLCRTMRGLVVIMLSVLMTIDAKSQIDVSGTIAGITPVTYPTLKAAFDAINAGTHTGVITINVTASTTEAAVPAAPTMILNPSGTGPSFYTAINMQPIGGAWTISGAASGGFPFIDMPGPDNVTINGLIGSTKSLTFSNTTVSTAANTCTFRIMADATNNTITNCIILGSSTGALAALTGNILFGNASVTTGCDNNTISNCDIGPAGSNLPTKLVTFVGPSNADPGTANSGNVVNNNNFFDWFSATISNAAIDVNFGTLNLSITNNRFYQTATRTITTTTSVIHSAIKISNSSGFGYVVSGNTIGYASNTQTGNTTIVFPASTSDAVIPISISVNTVASPLPASVQNNTIAGIVMSGAGSGTTSSAIFRGIYDGGGIVNIGDITGNTIGSQSATGNITYTSSSVNASDIIAIFNNGSSSWTANNNNIGGITLSNSSTGASNLYGIRYNTTTTVTSTIQNNIIGGTVANSLQSTTAATGTQVSGIFASTSGSTIIGNTIRNLTSAGGTGTTISASVIGMTFVSTSVNNTISQNTIYNLSNTNTSGAITVTGIQFTGSTANLIERNNIYGLTSSTTSTSAEINGIRIAGGTTTYKNNMIAIGAGVTNAIGTGSSTGGINGIIEPSATGTDNFLHNSIYIGGSPTAGVGPSYAFNSAVTTSARIFRDNIFCNARSNSGATGKNYAVRVGGAAPNPAGLTINNNVYYISGTGTVFGFFNAADVASLAAWKTAVGQDAASFETMNPQFMDPTNTTPNLHINPSLVSVIEGNGFDVGVTNDFDGQTRSGLTPVDIGADAGLFMGVDLTAPLFSYTPLSNGCTTSTNQTLTTTITDPVSGVPTSGTGLPMLYYKINAGAYTGVQGVFVSGNTYTFTFGAAAANFGDVVSYYIVAQDGATTPNVIASPLVGAGGYTANPPAASTPPTTPNTFLVAGTLSGTYTVGAGGNYTTLTAAINDYNAKCLGGPVVFNLTDATYGAETFPITINANAYASMTNSLTIKPAAGIAVTITGTSGVVPSALIRMNGAKYVTFDGINTGGASMAIVNTSVTAGTAVFWMSSNGIGLGASNNTIKNCNIKAGIAQNSSLNNSYGIIIAGSTISATHSSITAGDDNDNNTIAGNTFTKVRYGIYTRGGSASNPNMGTIISNNTIGPAAFGVDEIGTGGITVREEDGINISGNEIRFVGGDFANTTSGADRLGITFGTDAFWTPSSVYVKNALVIKNRIHDIVDERTFSAVGISIGAADGTNPTNNLVANNMIYNVKANGTFPDQIVGIGLSASNSDKIVFNSIYLAGDTDPNAGAQAPTDNNFGISINSSSVTNPLIRDNIIYMDLTSSSAPTLKNACINVPAAFVWGTGSCNYNDLYILPANAESNIGSITLSTSTFYLTLSAWQTASTQDANSLNLAPVFVSPTDLHLISASNVALGDHGIPIPGVTTDYDGDIRDVMNPDMGMDEFLLPPCSGAVGGTASVTGPSTFCGSGTPVITATGYSTGSGSGYQWMTSTVIGDYPLSGTPVVGQNNPGLLTTGIVTVTRYYWLKVTCTSGSSTAYSTMVTITITPSSALISGPTAKCANDPGITLNETGGTGTSWLWSTTQTTQSISVNPASTTSYTVTVTSPGSCTATATTTVNVNPNPTNVTAMASVGSACPGVPFNLSSTFTPLSPTILSEGFESGAPGWVFEDSSSTGIAISQQIFHIQPSPYTDGAGSATFLNFSISGANFAYANPDAGGTGSQTRTNLVSPAFSTIGYVGSGTLTFKHGYRYWDLSSPPERVEVQITSNGGTTWTTLSYYQGADVGVTTDDAQTTITSTVTVPALYIGLPNVKIRFRYRSNWGYYWVMDDVLLTGSPTPTFAWSSSPAGFTSTSQNPIGVTETVPTNYTMTVTSPAGCSAQASTGVIAINPPPTITLGSNPSVCSGITSTNLTYSSTTGSPDQYSVDFNPAAEAQGFTDVVNAILNPTITLTVPGSATPGIYNASLTVTNSSTGCVSNSYPITVTIQNPIVMNTLDSGAGSLRDIIACVGDGATITFDASIWNSTIALITGTIMINKIITIAGPTGADAVNISANGTPPVFNVTSGNLKFMGNVNIKQ